ncbi:MAG: hypothetical protein KME19_06120 [Microcoleus vaginatus WJT46-NPBG5]|nr:hypothetical protein [Microcoleus vaginatus WJT46-NPBG5]
MGQVTNVSQLRDVEPADWADEALSRVVLVTPAPPAESFFSQLRHDLKIAPAGNLSSGLFSRVALSVALRLVKMPAQCCKYY